MSDETDKKIDAVLAFLRERKAQLEDIAANTAVRLAENAEMIAAMSDGRSRVNRKLRTTTNSTATDAAAGDAAQQE